MSVGIWTLTVHPKLQLWKSSMLLGKTTQQAQEATQKRLQALYGKRHRKLALWPTKLTDGRIAWLRWVWAEYNIERSVYHIPDGETTYYFYERCKGYATYYADSGLPPDDGHFLGM